MADQRLLSIVDRVVRLEEERRGIAADVKDIYEEAKSAGYDPKAVRAVVKRRMEKPSDTEKREAVERERDLMLAALGDLASTPLGQAAAA